MTIIKIYGILSKEFGKELRVKVSDINNVISIIDCLRNGFRKRMLELQAKGYCFSVSEFKNKIYISPLIQGSGFWKSVVKVVSAPFKAVANVVKAVVQPVVKFIASLSKVVQKVIAITLMVVGAVLVITGVGTSLGIALISFGYNIWKMANFKMPKMKYPDPIFQEQDIGNISTGGGFFSVNAGSKSYIFQNDNNLYSQGSTIPIGYGLNKITSKTIQLSIKSYPISSTYSSEFESNPNFTSNLLEGR